jgi:hypothetical protein
MPHRVCFGQIGKNYLDKAWRKTYAPRLQLTRCDSAFDGIIIRQRTTAYAARDRRRLKGARLPQVRGACARPGAVKPNLRSGSRREQDMSCSARGEVREKYHVEIIIARFILFLQHLLPAEEI